MRPLNSKTAAIHFFCGALKDNKNQLHEVIEGVKFMSIDDVEVFCYLLALMVNRQAQIIIKEQPKFQQEFSQMHEMLCDSDCNGCGGIAN